MALDFLRKQKGEKERSRVYPKENKIIFFYKGNEGRGRETFGFCSSVGPILSTAAYTVSRLTTNA